jgi:hypothetical protein
VRDGAGALFLPGVVVPAGQLMTVPILEGGMQFDTLQVSASVAGQVYCWVRLAAPRNTAYNG